MDSMQIYRGMDIGTAKSTVEEMDGVPHHMLDVADPRENYSVAQYQQVAENVAQEIIQRGRQPLFVGGTGLYLRALRHPMSMGQAAADDALREALQQEADAPGGKEALHHRLAMVDPDTAERLPVNDVRRVIRALEVYELTGVPFSKQPQVKEEARFRYRVATLTMERSLLYGRIEQRVDAMMEQGLLDEIKGLLDAGVPADAQAMKAIGYKEIAAALDGALSMDEAIALVKQLSRNYAKKQMTWFKKDEEIVWIAPDTFQPIQGEVCY